MLMLAAVGLLVAGCASTNVNPPQARARTGYVDLYADSAADLSWEVTRYDDRAGSFQRAFSELKPPPDGVLRLALAPGRHQLRITFLNRVIVKPAEILVEVQNGKITPVCLTLSEAGAALVQTKQVSLGGTAHGSFGRRTKIGSDEAVAYRIAATADSPVAYQPKERMSYAR
jgi:hypothetical protein